MRVRKIAVCIGCSSLQPVTEVNKSSAGWYKLSGLHVWWAWLQKYYHHVFVPETTPGSEINAVPQWFQKQNYLCASSLLPACVYYRILVSVFPLSPTLCSGSHHRYMWEEGLSLWKLDPLFCYCSNAGKFIAKICFCMLLKTLFNGHRRRNSKTRFRGKFPAPTTKFNPADLPCYYYYNMNVA